MWPDFMPDYGDTGPERILPASVMCMENIFCSTQTGHIIKEIRSTYYLFHHHGDAFTTVYTEIPQNLTVVHDAAILSGQPHLMLLQINIH